MSCSSRIHLLWDFSLLETGQIRLQTHQSFIKVEKQALQKKLPVASKKISE